MLRWCLSTVRAFGGGHDSNPRLSCYFSRQTLRLSRSRFRRAYGNSAIPIADLVEEPKTSIVPLSSAVFRPTRDLKDVLPLSSKSSMGLLKDIYSESAVCFRARHFAIDTLRRFLSSENTTSDHPLTYSSTTIRSLYYRAESRNQLEMLDFKMLTLLIGLFGSLSIDPRVFVVYRHPLASRLLEMSTQRTHWAFVLKVGKYKLERGMPLHDSDHFWLMCAELAMVQARPKQSLSGDAYGAILRARTHYHIIRRHSRRPEVHTYYLEALLAIQDPRLLDFAARDLSSLLRTHRVCHPRLQRLLYSVVVQHGAFLSVRTQEVILAAFWSRACQVSSDLVPENGLSDIALDVITVAHSLSATLFGFASHIHKDKSVNSFGHLFSVFSPAYALPLRWSSLVLFSVFNSGEMLHVDGIHWTSDHAMPQPTSCWQVIFGLATVERISQEVSSAHAMQSTFAEKTLETTCSLHQLWLTIVKSSLVSPDLSCAIATSFLRIASILSDATLFHNCQYLYRAEYNLEGPRASMQNFFAAQYIAAAVRVHGPLTGVVLTALEAFSSDLKQQEEVLASAVEALAPMDASLAHTLYTVAQEEGKVTEPDPAVIHTIAMSLVQSGALRQAILLNDGRASLEKRGILVSAIARSLRENPRTRHPQSVFVGITSELAALYQSHVPPEHFRGHLEQLLVVLAWHGRGRQLLPVVLSVFRRLPSSFRSRFFVRYCRVLLQHRQFSTVRKLLDAIAVVYPKIARSLRVLTDQTAMQTKAFRASKRIGPLRGPTSLILSSRLRRCPHAASSLERSLQELLKSRRLLAAKHIFASAAARIPSVRRTALGNILLHGASRQPRPRNGRRVRKLLALLEDLLDNHAFRPDRVTANILIKAMVNWRSVFDSPRLRELFDQLVRGGYPAAEYSSQHPPFGTRQTQFVGSSGFSKLSSFVSFEKHSRPLFKMFIKGFYLCNDVEAARKVVGILKVEEHKNATVKEARRRARERGRIKAAQRNRVPLATPPTE